MPDPAHPQENDKDTPLIKSGGPDDGPGHDPGPKTGSRKREAPDPPPETEAPAEG